MKRTLLRYAEELRKSTWQAAAKRRGEQTVENQSLHIPLAARMRPKTLKDFVGHTKVLGVGTPLRRAIEQGTAGSLILWGPPGVGKTTLAEIIARQAGAAVERISAVTAGVKDLRGILGRAAEWRKINKPTVLIVDEIHRFNKAQQDVLLPAAEEGLVTLIGATTENPYFEVIAALVSRAEVIRLEKLSADDVQQIVRRAISGWLSGKKYRLAKQAFEDLTVLAGGDARRALNILERAMLVAGTSTISAQEIESAAQQSVVQYDKAADAHYDTISAFIKSLRGSDPDAALFYLFRMLIAGEDPKFIIRRMFIFASEDIGNADPHALMVVAAASQALQWVGLPEAEYNLAHAATYLAASPKSNSVTRAMGAAKADVQLHGNEAPPGHIINAPIAEMKRHNKGVGYKYPYDFPGNIVAQEYRPKVIQNNIYYEPGNEGFEREVKRRVEQARKILH